MKKILFSVFAVLFAVGIAHAGLVVDPFNGPMVEVIPVYNNDTVTMGTGSIAIWDMGSATGDDDNYVVLPTTADTFLVAGIVYPADIAPGKTGSVAIYGVVDVDTSSAAVAAKAALCTSTTPGKAAQCSDYNGEYATFGVAINAQTGTDSDKAFIKVR